jgi:hypothetical protein
MCTLCRPIVQQLITLCQVCMTKDVPHPVQSRVVSCVCGRACVVCAMKLIVCVCVCRT